MGNKGFTEYFTSTINDLKEQGNHRVLRGLVCDSSGMIEHQGKSYINLSSNDYLGISTDRALEREFLDKVMGQLDRSPFLMSNPSSRLITGNSPDYKALEDRIARLMGSEQALVLGSGYLLGVGIFGALTSADDLIVADKLVHSSIIDGIRLSKATLERFRHNDMNHLESILLKNRGKRIVVVTESLFSMDGDMAPLEDIAQLQGRHDFMLYLDQAHAFGAMGRGGRGVNTDIKGLRVDLHVATLGKAIASQGAFVACSTLIRDMLINRMRSLIFSTALPPISLMWSDFVISRLDGMQAKREHLKSLVEAMGGESYIVPIMAGSNQNALDMAQFFADNGFWTTAIRHPTVPQGQSRVRVSLSAALESEQILKFKQLCDTIG